MSRYGLDTDGLKIDFTASTPTGESLRHHGDSWDISLLHRCIDIVTALRRKPSQTFLSSPKPRTRPSPTSPT